MVRPSKAITRALASLKSVLRLEGKHVLAVIVTDDRGGLDLITNMDVLREGWQESLAAVLRDAFHRLDAMAGRGGNAEM